MSGCSNVTGLANVGDVAIDPSDAAWCNLTDVDIDTGDVTTGCSNDVYRGCRKMWDCTDVAVSGGSNVTGVTNVGNVAIDPIDGAGCNVTGVDNFADVAPVSPTSLRRSTACNVTGARKGSGE